MTAFLSFILVILFVGFVFVCVVAYRIYSSLRKVAKKFTGSKDDAGNRGRGAYSHTESDDEIIIDRRSPDEVRRKIFSKSEGEYVDFEEERQ